MSIGVMQRAHEESRTKGERVAAANGNKRQRARDHNVPITSLCPGWLRLIKPERGFEKAYFEVITERAAVICRIYLECVAGLGKRRITERLNRDGIAAFRGKDGWHHSSVSKILSNEAVLGLYQPNRKVDGKRIPEGPPIPGYFPPIIDDATFWQAQESIKIRQNNSAGRKGEADTNLFSGLGVCEGCGGKLRLDNKGPLPKGVNFLCAADQIAAYARTNSGFRTKISKKSC